MRPQRERDGPAAEHAPPHAPAHPRQAQPALRRRAPGWAGAAALLALAGCGTAPSDLAPPPGQRLAPAAQGIDVAGPGVGTGQEIGFGRAQAGAVAAVARVLGEEPAPAAVPPGCALTEVAWRRAGLALTFDGGAFVGWRAGGGRAFPGPVRQAGRVCSP